jgi:aryl-alcohol dehydrogenase-like predicted oxidoreductase
MRYKLLGRSGLRVSELALGTMTFGETWGWGASREESRRIFDCFVEQGGNFIDTANNYTDGTSEQYVGDCIASDRDHFVVATKYTLATRKDDPNGGGNHRKNMMQAVEASLKRLRTDYIDLYWLHMWDFLTPVEEVMRALDDLVRAGKVLYIGISDTPAWIVSQANTLADWRGWSRLVGLQVPYSLNSRDVERELLPMARAFDMAVLAWATISGGELTGKYQRPDDTPRRYGDDPISDQTRACAEAIAQVASELGRTPAQVAINWVRQQQARALIIPIVGARTAAQMRENLGCLEFTLTSEHLRRLEEASAFKPGFPTNFFASDEVKGLIYGNTLPLIDRHR